MKKMYLMRGVLLAFLAFQFLSCEDEPLTGEFPQNGPNNAEEGQFRAQIEGQEFIASTVTAILSANNELVITGEKEGGKSISLAITNAALGTFDLATGGQNQNAGIYFDGSQNALPYVSTAAFGGSGELNMTELNIADQTLSGTFSFVGLRMKMDAEGNPVLDGEGNPIMEEVAISSGAFNKIPFTIDGTDGGSGNSNNEFFAQVDGASFIPDSISVTEPVVGDVHMIKIEARANGALIRIDVPRTIGEGTFAMANISDGTELIGIYNEGIGGINLSSNPGSITISQLDLELGILKATFNFTGTDPLNQVSDSVEITEGNLTAHFEGIPGGNNRFGANVGTNAYNPDEIIVTTSSINQYPRVSIETTKGNQKMELSFPLTLTENTFDMATEIIDGNEIVASYTPEMSTSPTFTSNPGTLVITNYDMENGIIEGLFNFTAKDLTGESQRTYQISGGTFFIVLP